MSDAKKAAPLKVAIGSYGHTEAIRNGSIPIKGVATEMVEVNPIIAAFRRMVRDVEFDVCELAPTTYIIAREFGAPFIALPIFIMRRFHHGGFVCRPDSGIVKPKDLEGRKAGVRAYSVTSGVWTRGVLMNEYGLDNSKVTWVVDDEEHVTQLKLPANVVHTPPGKSLAGMMQAGEIEAGMTGNAGIGRAGAPRTGWESSKVEQSPDFYELIPDHEKAEADWFRRTGIYPTHGLIVAKHSALQAHPNLAASLMEAFSTAKEEYLSGLRAGTRNSEQDKKYLQFSEWMGDPLPYGLKANVPTMEALVEYGLQQGLIRKRPSLSDLFVET